MIKVTIISPEKTETVELKDDTVTIGRSSDNTIQISDAKASRKHCKIEKTNGTYTLTDLESVNGILLNSRSVTFSPLKEGDEIVIGNTLISIAEISIPQIQKSAPPPKPVERSKVISAIRSYAPLALAIIAIIIAINIISNIRLYSTSKNESQEGYIAEVKQKIKGLKLEVVIAPTIDKSYTERASKLREDIELIEDNEEREECNKMVDFVLQEMIMKKNAILEADYSDMNRRVNTALKDNNYSEAINIATAYTTTSEDPLAKYDLAKKLILIEQKAQEDFDNIQKFTDILIRDKKYDAAKEYLLKNSERFRNTKYYNALNAQAGSIVFIANAEVLLPAEIAEKKRQEALKLLRPKIENANMLTSAAKFMEAEKAYKELLNEDIVKSEPAILSLFKLKYDELREQNHLYRKLIEAINNNTLSDMSITIGSKEGSPISADEKGITFLFRQKAYIKVEDRELNKDNSEKKLMSWSDISPLGLFKLFQKVKLTDDELYGLAVFCENNKLKEQAFQTVNGYVGKDTGLKRKKGFELIARLKGLSSVPDGGFVWEASIKEYLTQREKNDSFSLIQAKAIAKHLETLIDVKTFDTEISKLYELYSAKDMSPNIRDSIKETAVSALNANFKYRLNRIRSAGSGVNMSKLIEERKKLDEARREALRIIYDLKIYLPESQGGFGKQNPGQAKVDEAVERVRKIWEGGSKLVLESNPQLANEIDIAVKINEEYLKKFGEAPGGDVKKELGELIYNLGRKVNLKNVALNAEEQATARYNEAVEKYNTAIKDVLEEVKEHIRILNDYREMLGRRRLFIDVRLVRSATKHSAACNAAGRIWHVGSDGSPTSRANAEGFPGGAGENVLINARIPDPQAAFDQWYEASDHHRNMLSDGWNTMGAGHVGKVWTQNFGRIQPPF